MNIDFNTGNIYENSELIFWKGMTEPELKSLESSRNAVVTRIKRESAYQLQDPIVLFNMKMDVVVIFRDQIVREINLRFIELEERKSRVENIYREYSLENEREYLLTLLLTLIKREPNIISRPEKGYRFTWGEVKVVVDLKGGDCYLVIKY